MGLSFINKKKWQDITRVESFFCSHLYHTIINREKEFVEWLNDNTTLKLNPKSNWEIGYEVCFYRDIKKCFHNKDKKIEEPWNYSNSRTFDLCLLSNDHIVIIETKAHEKFDGKQRKDAIEKKDILDIKKLLGSLGYVVKVDFVLLHSSRYSPRNELPKITWIDVYNTFDQNELFKRADSLYGN